MNRQSKLNLTKFSRSPKNSSKRWVRPFDDV